MKKSENINLGVTDLQELSNLARTWVHTTLGADRRVDYAAYESYDGVQYSGGCTVLSGNVIELPDGAAFQIPEFAYEGVKEAIESNNPELAYYQKFFTSCPELQKLMVEAATWKTLADYDYDNYDHEVEASCFQPDQTGYNVPDNYSGLTRYASVIVYDVYTYGWIIAFGYRDCKFVPEDRVKEVIAVVDAGSQMEDLSDNPSGQAL